MHTQHELTYALDLLRLRLRAYRLAHRESQQEWAELLRCHRPSVTLMEQGRQQLRPMQLLAALDHVRGDPRWFLGMDLWYESGTITPPLWWENPTRLFQEEWSEAARLMAEYRARGSKPTKKGGKR